MQLPDAVVGIGGVGKRVVHEALTTDWLVRAGLSNNGNALFNAATLDTCSIEHSDDQTRAVETSEHVRRLADELGVQPGAAGDHIHVHLPDAGGAYGTPAALRDDAVGREIIDATPLSTWWPAADGASPRLDGFADGTVRRRELGKALFHAADANGGLDELFATLDGADEIVVVAGLGGGTGSGVAPDLARALDRHARVSLLGLLPTDEDDGAGAANAHATLSELEYCWLTDQSPFDDVVLLSPPVTEPGLRQAAVHALVGWANVTQPQFRPGTASGPPDHAPFTVAVPAVSRLVVPALEEAQDRLYERREALDVELTLYDKLEALLPHLFDAFETRLDAPERLLDEAQPGHVEAVFDALDAAVVVRLADRLKGLRSGLDGDGVDLLDLSVADAWLDAFEEIERDAGASGDRSDSLDGRRATLGLLYRSSIENLFRVDAPADGRAAGLHDCIETELRALRVRIRLLAAATAFERPELAQVLQSLLDTESRLPPEAHRLRDEIRLRNEEHREHIDQLDAVREAAAAAIEAIAHEWVATTDAEAARLVALEDSLPELKPLLAELEDALVDFATTVSQYDLDGPEQPGAQPGIQKVDAINNRLRALNLDGVDEQRIYTSVDGVRRAWQIAAEAESSLLPGFLHPQDFETEYAAALDQVDPGLFRVSRFDEPFRCSYVGDLRADVMDHLYQQRDAGISDLRDAFDAQVVDAELPARLDTQPPGPVDWPADATPIGGETVVRIIEDASGDEDEALDALHERAKAYLAARWLESLDEKRDQAVVDLDAREQQVELLDTILDELEPVAHHLATLRADHWRALVEKLDVEQPRETPSVTPVRPRQPETLLPAASLADAAPARADLDALRTGLVGAVQRAELPLTDQHGDLTEHHRAETVYASGGFEPSGPIEGTDAVDAAVRERLGPATRHASVRLESGPPWGIAAVTLVGGIHLNNLSPVVRPGGYLDRYEDGADSRDGSMLWHHGHGLGGRDTRFVEDADAMYLVKEDLPENNVDDALETCYRFTPIQSDVTADQE